MYLFWNYFLTIQQVCYSKYGHNSFQSKVKFFPYVLILDWPYGLHWLTYGWSYVCVGSRVWALGMWASALHPGNFPATSEHDSCLGWKTTRTDRPSFPSWNRLNTAAGVSLGRPGKPPSSRAGLWETFGGFCLGARQPRQEVSVHSGSTFFGHDLLHLARINIDGRASTGKNNFKTL